MSKKRKTVTLDPEVKAYLDSEGRNASETVNKLVKMDMGEGVANKQLLQMRMEMEKDRYEAAASKAKGHLERFNQLKDQLEKAEREERDGLAEAREVLGEVPKEPDNPAIQNWAEDLDMTPSELLEEL